MVKRGFSLAEALIVMAIISVFFAAATKVVTVKRPEPNIQTPHGFFHCSQNIENGNGGIYTQQYTRNGIREQAIQRGNGCRFIAPIGVNTYNIYAYGKHFAYSSLMTRIDKPLIMSFEQPNPSSSTTRELTIRMINSNGEVITESHIQSQCEDSTNNCNNSTIAPQIFNSIKLYHPELANTVNNAIENDVTQGFVLDW